MTSFRTAPQTKSITELHSPHQKQTSQQSLQQKQINIFCQYNGNYTRMYSKLQQISSLSEMNFSYSKRIQCNEKTLTFDFKNLCMCENPDIWYALLPVFSCVEKPLQIFELSYFQYLYFNVGSKQTINLPYIQYFCVWRNPRQLTCFISSIFTQ